MAENGRNKVSAEQRRALFVNAYVANGGNATRAAISAGYSANSARVTGSRLLTNVDIAARIAAHGSKVLAAASQKTALTIENVQRELARLVFSDPRKLFRPDGTAIPIHELDDDAAATIAGYEVKVIAGGANPAEADDEDEFEERRRDQVVLSTHKVKTYDKNAAIVSAMRHLGMFERDNAQKGDNLMLKIEVVG